MKTIVKRIGLTELEPMITYIPNMDAKLEKSSDGVYVLVFTGTNEDGDKYSAEVVPSSVEVVLASEHEKVTCERKDEES